MRPPPERKITGLTLVLSDDFDPRDAEAARAALSEHLEVGEPTVFGRFAADPHLVSIVRLIGDVTTWLPLKTKAPRWQHRASRDPALPRDALARRGPTL